MWTGSIAEALNANFVQPDGTSRPGEGWTPEQGELPAITLSDTDS